MEHLKRNDCAFVANDRESLKTVVEELLTDREKRARLSENARATAERYHVSAANSLRLKTVMKRIVEGL